MKAEDIQKGMKLRHKKAGTECVILTGRRQYTQGIDGWAVYVSAEDKKLILPLQKIGDYVEVEE